MTQVRPVVGVIDPSRPCNPAHVGLHLMTDPDRLVLPDPAPIAFEQQDGALTISPFHPWPTTTYYPRRTGIGWLTREAWNRAGLHTPLWLHVEDDDTVLVEWRWLEAL